MLAERLRNRRKEMRLSQEQLADKIGITRQGYGHYETGRNEPDFETLIKISEILQCSLDYLLGKTYITDENEISKDLEEIVEISQVVKESGINEFHLLNPENWRRLSKDDLDEINRHFEWISEKAKKRNNDH